MTIQNRRRSQDHSILLQTPRKDMFLDKNWMSCHKNKPSKLIMVFHYKWSFKKIGPAIICYCLCVSSIRASSQKNINSSSFTYVIYIAFNGQLFSFFFFFHVCNILNDFIFSQTHIKLNLRLKLKLVFRPLLLCVYGTLNFNTERCPSSTRNINPQSRPACCRFLEIFDLKPKLHNLSTNSHLLHVWVHELSLSHHAQQLTQS